MDQTSILRVVEGVFISILASLTPEQAKASVDALCMMADCATTPLGEALCYRQIAYSAEPLVESGEDDSKPAPSGGILGSHFETTIH